MVDDKEIVDIISKLEDIIGEIDILDENDYNASLLYFDLLEYWGLVHIEL